MSSTPSGARTFPLFGAALALVTGAFAPVPASAAPTDLHLDPVQLEVVTANGTGCPPGTASMDYTADKTAVTVTFSQFAASSGPNVDAKEARKACQIALDVKVPKGYSFAVVKGFFRGYADVAAGASGRMTVARYFQGATPDESIKREITGPHKGSYVADDVVRPADLVWSPCGETRYLNIKTSLDVKKGTSTTASTLTADPLTIDTARHFAFRPC